MSRHLREKIFRTICYVAAASSVIGLVLLLGSIVWDGWHRLTPTFFTSFPSRFPDKAGILAPLVGSFWMLVLTTLIAVPLGVLTALYLEEYAGKSRFLNMLQLNISTLAGMPSIVYGLLGLAIFVRFMGLEKSLLSGSLCLSLLILPVIIISSQGAIRAVPNAIREGAYAIGARRYRVVFGQVLPAAIPGIMTGVILAISRAVGESAPLILIGALSYIAFLPKGPMDSFTVLPVQIYNWASRPQPAFHELAAAAIIVLLVMLFCFNLIAVFIRQKYQRYK